eukprot:3284794-Rhodomonas_salina.1
MLQMQSVMSSLPISESVLAGQIKQAEPSVLFRYVPAAQFEQTPEPFTSLKVPSAQALHASPSEPSNPMLQMQSVLSSLPIREFVFAGQAAHAVPPVRLRNEPGSQGKHNPDPFAGLKVPASHALQAPHGS